MVQRYPVLTAVEETRSTPTEIVHLVGERSLSLHLSPQRMRSPQPDLSEENTHSADKVNGIRTIIGVCAHDPSQPRGR